MVRMALLALVVRALVPVGWMPAVENGKPGLGICNVMLGEAPANPHDAPDTSHGEFCAFAASAITVQPPVPASVAAPGVIAWMPSTAVADASAPRIDRYNATTPRAPPSIV